MKIEFVRAWRCYTPGSVVDWPGDGVANILIRAGHAVEAVDVVEEPKKKAAKNTARKPVKRKAKK